jgi:curved DNA-binding protein CbpA
VNHYEALGVPVDADDGTIRSAFRRLARQYHPDAGTGSSSEKFREVTEAYETLIDPLRRRTYDQSLNRPEKIPIHVEPLRANPRRYQPRPPMPRSGFPERSMMELHLMVEQIFRALEDDLFFGWRR